MENTIQEVLDMQVNAINSGNNELAEKYTIILREMIKDKPAPPCFGHDDCSTLMLCHCPWQHDCGE